MGFFDEILKKVGSSSDSLSPKHSEDLEAIEALLRGYEGSEARLIAATAMMLSRVIYADREISDGERKRMKEGLMKEMGLSDSLADNVCDVALNQIKKLNTEEHIVNRVVNEIATAEQKEMILKVAFHVAAEEMISEKESNMIRVISSALGFSHRQFIALRSEFRDSYKALKA